jgi:hypothetical protein
VGLDSSVGVATLYVLDSPRIESRWGEIFHTDHGAHPAFYATGAGSISRGYGGRGVALTIHPYQAPTLKKE